MTAQQQALAARAETIVARMAEQIVALSAEGEACVVADLIASGFTREEVELHQDAAIAAAVALREAAEAGAIAMPRRRPCPLPMLAAPASYPPAFTDPINAEIDAIERRFDGPIPDEYQRRVAALRRAQQEAIR